MNELRLSDKIRFWLIRRIAGHRVIAHNLTIRNGGIEQLDPTLPTMITYCTIIGAPVGITVRAPQSGGTT